MSHQKCRNMPTEMPRQWQTVSFICPEGQQRRENFFITLTLVGQCYKTFFLIHEQVGQIS
jgi:hypothetical protein